MSGAKFKIDGYYKHKHDCCDFIQVKGIYYDSGVRADLFVSMFTQEHKGWRELTSAISINVSKANYIKWEPYQPRGEFHES